MNSDEEDKRVRPVLVARLARRADLAGQLPLAAFLYALALDLDEHWPDEWHRPEVETDPTYDKIIDGRKLARRTTPDARE